MEDSALFFARLLQRISKKRSKAKKIKPPITPPAIAPVFVVDKELVLGELELEGRGEEFDMVEFEIRSGTVYYIFKS